MRLQRKKKVGFQKNAIRPKLGLPWGARTKGADEWRRKTTWWKKCGWNGQKRKEKGHHGPHIKNEEAAESPEKSDQKSGFPFVKTRKKQNGSQYKKGMQRGEKREGGKKGKKRVGGKKNIHSTSVKKNEGMGVCPNLGFSLSQEGGYRRNPSKSKRVTVKKQGIIRGKGGRRPSFSISCRRRGKTKTGNGNQ